MIIQSSNVSMTGSSRMTEKYTKEESLKFWVDGNNGNNGNDGNNGSNLNQLGINNGLGDAFTLEISDQGKAMLEQASSIKNEDYEEIELSDKDKQKLVTLQRMLEVLTGKKIKFLIPKKIKVEDIELKLQQPLSQNNNAQNARQGWGLIYEAKENYEKHEKMSFSTDATIVTGDGRKINIQMDINMSRDFAYSSNISFRAGDATKIDPLVINLDVPTVGLTDEKFSFDLDSDGSNENISFTADGSGFLALDLNEDGSINDGSELFGTKSGNGFEDLAQYDSDNNNWIDENDPIFEKLKIWTKDDAGNDVLFALGQKGVGAIYLGSVATNFDLQDSANNLTGEISRSGFYVSENGKAGTIQHVDIVV